MLLCYHRSHQHIGILGRDPGEHFIPDVIICNLKGLVNKNMVLNSVLNLGTVIGGHGFLHAGFQRFAPVLGSCQDTSCQTREYICGKTIKY